MHHGHRHHGHRRGMRFGRFNRDDLSARLEEYQRDLEQELADVTDLLRRLRENEPQPPATATA